MQIKKVKATFALLLLLGAAAAQEAATAAGGDISGTGGSVAYSVGQAAYISNSGSTGSESQGVQQPYVVTTAAIADPAYSLSISVFPNPATNQLILQAGEIQKGTLSYALFDAQGKLVVRQAIIACQTYIDMNACAPGAYLLSVTRDNMPVKTFKIIRK